jgi:hypothetical protein
MRDGKRENRENEREKERERDGGRESERDIIWLLEKATSSQLIKKNENSSTQIQETLVPPPLSPQSSWEAYDSEEDDQASPQPQHGDEVLRRCRRKCSDLP